MKPPLSPSALSASKAMANLLKLTPTSQLANMPALLHGSETPLEESMEPPSRDYTTDNLIDRAASTFVVRRSLPLPIR